MARKSALTKCRRGMEKDGVMGEEIFGKARGGCSRMGQRAKPGDGKAWGMTRASSGWWILMGCMDTVIQSSLSSSRLGLNQQPTVRNGNLAICPR